MTVSRLIGQAFAIAAQEHHELHEAWVKLSIRWGWRLPKSDLGFTIQRHGRLDMVLRSMESEAAEAFSHDGPDADGYLNEREHLSGLWVLGVYETVRLMTGRKIAPGGDAFERLKRDLELIRMPLAKHEIASDNKLNDTLKLITYPPSETDSKVYEYRKGDPLRAHIMPSGYSRRGSTTWHAIDIKSGKARWIERLDLSERIIAFASE